VDGGWWMVDGIWWLVVGGGLGGFVVFFFGVRFKLVQPHEYVKKKI
jgi:hypothetical protein